MSGPVKEHKQEYDELMEKVDHLSTEEEWEEWFDERDELVKKWETVPNDTEEDA